jgi:hypothetical protein
LIADARSALPALAAGIACLVLALLPAALVPDSTVLHVTSNHDAFFYVSATEWLHNEGIRTPTLTLDQAPGSDAPFLGPAFSTMDSGLRLGENLVAAAVPLPGDAEQNWLALTGVWCLLLALASGACARAAGLRPGYSGLVALLAGSAALTTFQVFNQNSPSILGMAFALVLAAALPVALEEGRRWAVAAGLLLAALFGTYTELGALLAPALVALVIGARRRWWQRVSRGALVVAVALVCAPLIWIRAWEALRLVAGAGTAPGWLSGADPLTFLSKALGVAPFDGAPIPLSVLQLFAIAALLGYMVVGTAASVLQPTRLLWPVFALTLLVYGWRLMTADPPFGYTVSRMVMFTMPLLLAASAVGIGGLAIRAEAGNERRSWTSAVAVFTSAVVIVGVSTSLDYLLHVRQDIRAVDSSYAEASSWISDLDNSEGSNTAVAAFDFVNQLWISEAGRGLQDVAYPVLDPSYFRINSHWDGEDNRYLLVDTSVMLVAPAPNVLRQNTRFALLDSEAGDVAVLAPQGITSGSGWLPNQPLGIPRAAADPTPDTWMADRAFAFVAGPRSGRVELAVEPDGALGPVQLTIRGPGVEPVDQVISGPSAVTVAFLPGHASSRIELTAIPTGGTLGIGRTLLFSHLAANPAS